MSEKNILHSEADITYKLLNVWLADCGIQPGQISPEYTFHIQLGRNVHEVQSRKPTSRTVRPRADILVRSREGKNMLIIEAKAPGEPLDNSVRKQGICYARLLKDGGIAPFVLLTNGKETKIFDSISGEQVDGTSISADHPYVKAGFRVSTNDLALRAEALETFIALSPENLKNFCRLQVDSRMARVRGDINSEKKYIPATYVERREAKDRLSEFLEEQQRTVILVLGSPQVGKTSFLCHEVEDRLSKDIACLFYSAVGMKKGLLGSICEDLTWILGDESSAYQVIHNKLSRILRQVGRRLAIFVDGWNEVDPTLAAVIGEDCEKLLSHDISCVLSMTTIAAQRLLLDNADNPTPLSEAARVSKSEIALLQAQQETTNGKWSTIFIGKYTYGEALEAYGKYAKEFNVRVPASHLNILLHESTGYRYFLDPFLLRTAMELFQGQDLPGVLDEHFILQQNLDRKALRSADLRGINVQALLSKLANKIFMVGGPIPLSEAMLLWEKSPIDRLPRGLYEAGILTESFSESGVVLLDFYYDRDRDFSIAYWSRQWPAKFLGDQGILGSELAMAVQSRAGVEALDWFLRQLEHIRYLQRAFEYFPAYDNPEIRRVLLTCLYHLVERQGRILDEDMESLVVEAIPLGISDPSMRVRVEASQFLELDAELITPFINEILLINLLESEEEFPFDYREDLPGEPTSSIVLRAFSEVHFNTTPEDESPDNGSELTDMLLPLLHHTSQVVRSASTKALGYLVPQILLENLSQMTASSKIGEDKKKDYVLGIELMTERLYAHYFGPDRLMSQNAIYDYEVEALEERAEVLYEELGERTEVLCEEYAYLYELCIPIIQFYWHEKCSDALLAFLRDTQPPKRVLDLTGFPAIKEVMYVYADYHVIISPPQQIKRQSPYRQLLLPFPEVSSEHHNSRDSMPH